MLTDGVTVVANLTMLDFLTFCVCFSTFVTPALLQDIFLGETLSSR